MILQSQESYDELIRLRKVVELGTLMLLSEREDFDRTALQTALENFEEACREENPDAVKRLDRDIEFHNVLTRATGNRLLVEINDMINRLTYTSREKTIRKVIQDNQMDYLIRTHQRFADIISQNDMQQFRDAVQDSFHYWKDIYK